jgi:hypothetical protein
VYKFAAEQHSEMTWKLIPGLPHNLKFIAAGFLQFIAVTTDSMLYAYVRRKGFDEVGALTLPRDLAGERTRRVVCLATLPLSIPATT